MLMDSCCNGTQSIQRKRSRYDLVVACKVLVRIWMEVAREQKNLDGSGLIVWPGTMGFVHPFRSVRSCTVAVWD